MKTAIILSEGIKQIMFTPENDQEKMALRMLTPDDDIQLAVKNGAFVSGYETQGFKVGMCGGGFLRAWSDENSVMLVLTPKQKEETEQSMAMKFKADH